MSNSATAVLNAFGAAAWVAIGLMGHTWAYGIAAFCGFVSAMHLIEVLKKEETK